MTGKWPVEEIDHKNRRRADDRWTNLREATSGNNKYNKAGWAKKEQYKGVYASGKKWRAAAMVNYKNYHLGSFENPEDAAAAYDAFVCKAHGEFAQPNFPPPLIERDWLFV